MYIFYKSFLYICVIYISSSIISFYFHSNQQFFTLCPVTIVQIQQFLLDFCTHRTFSIIPIFYRSYEYHFLLIPRIKTPGLLQHFVAPIAHAPHLCYTTPTSNFGHDIFIMFQRPWKSPARISFLNFIAFSAKNSLRFLMMLLIHRNFKCPCTCTSCMHTGQMLRYF